MLKKLFWERQSVTDVACQEQLDRSDKIGIDKIKSEENQKDSMTPENQISSNELTTSLNEVRREMLADPEFRQAYEDLEVGYQVTRLRIKRGLTQKQLADLVGTQQPSIARLENRKKPPELSFLKKVVEALGGTLTIKIEASDSNPTACTHGTHEE